MDAYLHRSELPYYESPNSTSIPAHFPGSHGLLPLPIQRYETSSYNIEPYDGLPSPYPRPSLHRYGGLAPLLPLPPPSLASRDLPYRTDLFTAPIHGISSSSFRILPLPNVLPPQHRADGKRNQYEPTRSLKPVRKLAKQARPNLSVQGRKGSAQKYSQKALSSQGQSQREDSKARKQGLSPRKKIPRTRSKKCTSLQQDQLEVTRTGNQQSVSFQQDKKKVSKVGNKLFNSGSIHSKSQLDDYSLAKEALELHNLFRTGVDPDTGKRTVFLINKKDDSNIAVHKRKPKSQKEAMLEADDCDDKAQTSVIMSKKRKRRKNKKKKKKIKKEEELGTMTSKSLATSNVLKIDRLNEELELEAEPCSAGKPAWRFLYPKAAEIPCTSTTKHEQVATEVLCDSVKEPEQVVSQTFCNSVNETGQGAPEAIFNVVNEPEQLAHVVLCDSLKEPEQVAPEI